MDKKFQENVSNQLQLGALDKDLVLLFRKQTGERKFKKVDVLRIMTNWWLDMDISDQRDLYHGIGTEQPKADESSIDERIETVRDLATLWKIPDAEQALLIASLRKALKPEAKQSSTHSSTGSREAAAAAAEDDNAALQALGTKRRNRSRRKDAESA